MLLFLAIYFCIYGGAHLYLLSRTVHTFHLSPPFPALVALFALLMVLAPILVRMLERFGCETAAKVAGYLGYLWMGFFFLFLSASVAMDLLAGVLALAGWLWGHPLVIPGTAVVAASAAIALASTVYGYFEARSLKIERVTLASGKIPAGQKIRIVQISDVHLGLMVGRERLERMLAEIERLQPDLVVSTGDLVDGQKDGLRFLDRELARIKPPLGKYAVLGNHEAFAGAVPSSSFTEHAGFRLLREESVEVGDCLTVAGVDDPALSRGGKGATDHLLLRGHAPQRYTVLLKHRPAVEREAVGLFDLQLSGHVHKGQLFPFNLLTHLAYPVKMGLSKAGDGSFLYVSRGTGTWGPPVRVLAPPEITVIDLVSSSL
ncbi:serine/threonine phosphatase [Geomonas sp. Red276]